MPADSARSEVAESGQDPNRRRWTIAVLLGLGVLVNYFDRVNLSVSHDALFAAFGISDFTFGLLLGAYNWTYALCQLPSGILLDRFGVRRVGCVSTLLWSMASFGAAITPGLGGFFAARFLLGVGEAPSFPASAKAVGYWFPARERSLATSFFDGAAKLAIGDWRAADWLAAVAGWMAAEFCGHRRDQPGLLPAVLGNLSRSSS